MFAMRAWHLVKMAFRVQGMPVVRSYDQSLYLKEDAGRMLIGLFEPNARPAWPDQERVRAPYRRRRARLAVCAVYSVVLGSHARGWLCSTERRSFTLFSFFSLQFMFSQQR
jgi:hypothetical protein